VAAGPAAAELEAQLQQERERTARLQAQLQVRTAVMQQVQRCCSVPVVCRRLLPVGAFAWSTVKVPLLL
jgi:hypothetical protein